MFNEHSLAAISDSWFAPRLRQPRYGDYCFSRIPASIRWLFGGKEANILPADCFGTYQPGDFDSIICIFVDALGWKFFQRLIERPDLKAVIDQGVLSTITSQFPSTTTAHVTTMLSGLEVGQSGMYEWNMYSPEAGEVVVPLPFRRPGEKERDTLIASGFLPEHLYPRASLVDDLLKLKVKSLMVGDRGILSSATTTFLGHGAETHSCDSETFVFGTLRRVLDLSSARQFAYVYFDSLDTAAHRHGPSSSLFETTVDEFFERFVPFLQRLKKDRRLIMVFADHGQVDTPEGQLVRVDKLVPEIAEAIAIGKNGKVIGPAGNLRDLFLHIKPDAAAQVREVLAKKLTGAAEVYLTEDLIAAGLFGDQPVSEVFRARVGNVVVLPLGNHSVWWGTNHRPHEPGHHGGLSPDEMDIPLLLFGG